MSSVSLFLTELAKQPVLLGGIIALTGSLIGSVIGLTGAVVVPFLSRRAERKTLRSALAAEIWALLGIVEARGYIPEIERQLALARVSPLEQQDGFGFYFSASADYFAVYHANLTKIGLLKPPVVANVIGFYCIAAAVLEDSADIREGEVMNREQSIERLEGLLFMFKDLTAFGPIVVAKLNRRVMKSRPLNPTGKPRHED